MKNQNIAGRTQTVLEPSESGTVHTPTAGPGRDIVKENPDGTKTVVSPGSKISLKEGETLKSQPSLIDA